MREKSSGGLSGRLYGIFQHYLLVRPYPSLKVVFTSPSMRIPGSLQSSFLDRIKDIDGMRSQIEEAFARGQDITAKVLWLSSRRHGSTSQAQFGHRREMNSFVSDTVLQDDAEDRLGIEDSPSDKKWLHCTPLYGVGKKIGVWMVVIVDHY